MPAVNVTYYLDVISSWCLWAEPAWQHLRRSFDSRVGFDWKIALMDAQGLPTSTKQSEWFYKRSGTLMRSPRMLSAGWFEEGVTEYLAPNAVAEAARALGAADDRVRLALAEAGMGEGRKIGQWEESCAIAARVAGVDPHHLRRIAESPETIQKVRATTAEFHAFKMTARPAFLVESEIGDRAVFSGLAVASPLASVIEAFLHDAAGYRAYAAHHGGPPAC